MISLVLKEVRVNKIIDVRSKAVLQRREDSTGPCKMGRISKWRKNKQKEMPSREMMNRSVCQE